MSHQQTMEKYPGREATRLHGDVPDCGAPAALVGLRVEELITLPGGWETGDNGASVSPQIPRKGEPLPLRELSRPEGLWTRVPLLFSCSLPAISVTALVPRYLKCLNRHPLVILRVPVLGREPPARREAVKLVRMLPGAGGGGGGRHRAGSTSQGSGGAPPHPGLHKWQPDRR